MPDRGPQITIAQATWLALVLAAACGCTNQADGIPSASPRDESKPAAAAPSETAAAEYWPDGVTFADQVAGIVYQHCSPCHRPGESAPFALLSYGDVKRHARQIVEVTSSRFMPPWLPDASVVHYANERVLTERQIAAFAAWVAAGTPLGDPEQLPPVPQFTAGWQLGEPDLVVRMAEPFEVPADGPDIYRNFVIPIPIDKPRWVAGMELRPGNRRNVHHAFMLTDSTRALRQLDAQDPEPGFPGMDTRSAQSPSGHFISWQPGRLPRLSAPGMSWILTPGTDLILQVHMQPSGKPETLQASVGLYFTDEQPTKWPFKMYLRSVDIDIPAGESHYEIRDQYVLPVDVQLLAVSPHAHYLGKQMRGIAELPDGKRIWLLKIDDWDLNWQGDYVFAEPINLPKGTRLIQEFVYDNSTANVRNPNHPPKRVKYGLEATDEMGSLWLQLLPANQQDYDTLRRDYAEKVLQEIYVRYRRQLDEQPDSVEARIELGKIALAKNRPDVARAFFDEAQRLAPDQAEPAYYAGHVRLRVGDRQAGIERLRRAVTLDPQLLLAQHDLGLAGMLQRDWPDAADHLEKALEIDPYDTTVLRNLAITYAQLSRVGEARGLVDRALQVEPRDPKLLELKQQLDGAR